MQPAWEHFDHVADMGVRGRGDTRAGAFEGAALALTALVADPARVRDVKKRNVVCTAPDDELLLIDWLNRIIFEMNANDELYGRFAVEIADGKLRGTLWGEAIDYGRHRPAVDPKAATMTALKVGQDDDGLWRAECVVDV